jgi:hypothetical protein
MSELLNSGKVGLTVFRNLAEQRQAIVNNWEDSGLLEGLKGMKKANTAQLMENQAQAMLNEVTLDSSAGRFDTVAFPIVMLIIVGHPIVAFTTGAFLIYGIRIFKKAFGKGTLEGVLYWHLVHNKANYPVTPPSYIREFIG